jgi:hypothetical protein
VDDESAASIGEATDDDGMYAAPSRGLYMRMESLDGG